MVNESTSKITSHESVLYTSGGAKSYRRDVSTFYKSRSLTLTPRVYIDDKWMKFKPFSCFVSSLEIENGLVKTDVLTLLSTNPAVKGWVPYETADWDIPWTFENETGSNAAFLYRKTSEAQSLHNKAVAKFNEELINSPIDIAVFFGELSETVQMYAQTLDRLGRAISAVRRKQFGKAAKILGTGKPKGTSPNKAFADNWLLYRYGVMPHVSEVNNLVQHCLAAATESKYVYVRKYAKQPINYKRKTIRGTNRGYGVAPVGLDCSREFTLKGEHKIVFGCLVEITNPTIAKLGQYGLINPLATGWELVPGSFILDWAFNIGDLLQALHAWAGKRMVSGFKSESIKATLHGQTVIRPGTTKVSYSQRHTLVTAPTYKEQLKWVNRTTLTSPPSLSISVSNGLNATRILDAVTLLNDRIVGRRR